MEEMAARYARVFKGMERADTDPIHINIREDGVPVAQGRRTITHQLRDAAQEKLQYMLDNDLIEGPLPPSECKGWIHNIMVTKKMWDSHKVRIVKMTILIPTMEELRHELEGSD